ncbi:TetR/AcrR family transcriptional regulator [Silvimonas iriomotensis]|uniref:TetR family transcriptional regulator n=1 Tax=Silvimonas iriomotensis TaxID=449662 RepID=A0ABQ2P7Z9_9NEIS|nr:TetR/AcrR family transcriptional regulator [Silvimonas iriomotensis]GGP20155.1 TetR family transcriptional regulator [Silvimonas iriomotensis]
MAAQLSTREEVVDTLMQVFRDHGYDGASLSILSEATGLGRSSLYHYFPNGKADMGAAVLVRASEFVRQNMLAPLQEEGDPQARIARFASALDTFYSGGKSACLTNVFAVGEAGELFGQRLGERLQLLIDALAGVACDGGLTEAEAQRRAEDVVISVHGALVVSHALDDTATFRRIVAELPGRLLGGAA